MLDDLTDLEFLARRAAQHFVAAGRTRDPEERSEHRREALMLADRIWERHRLAGSSRLAEEIC